VLRLIISRAEGIVINLRQGLTGLKERNINRRYATL
jgi:hypothetical protein